MHGVVAVLHEHAAPVPELHGNGDTAAGAEAVDILAATLPQWDVTGFPIAGENLTLLKVDVDRVIPATATVLQCPDLARPVFRRCRDATEVRSEHGAAIGLHAPGAKGTRNGVIGGLA